MSEQSFEMIAKTFQGLEEVLAQELTALGANEIEIGRRMVSFSGDKEMMYKANFCLRTAIRILKPIKHFTAKDADEVYEQIKAIRWEDYLDTDKTFAVDAVVFSEEFRHSKFVSYKVKDAIVDYFREKTGERPGVRVNKPDVLLNIHIAETKCTLSLDSSGESLHRRGYRQEAVEAPLNEVLAAGMILMTGWRGECDLIDPMCGSGTIPIEAALIARNIAPGVFRKEFAFEKWVDFDQELFDTIYNDDSQEREFTHKIYGYDNSPKANEIATHNIKAAGVSKDVILKLQPFQQFEQPAEKSIIITNPPYGERISTNDLLGLYSMIGERLKHAFTGNTAWILSYREECFDQIRAKSHLQDTFIQWCAGMRIPPVRNLRWKVQGIPCRRRGVEQGAQRISSGFWGTKEFNRRKTRIPSPDSVERDVNSVAKDASSTANADQENSRTAKSANSVRVKEESSRMGKDGSSDRGKDVNSVENAEQGWVSLTRKAKEERRERRKKNNTNNDKENECKENK